MTRKEARVLDRYDGRLATFGVAMLRKAVPLLLPLSAIVTSCGSGPTVDAFMAIDTGERKRTTFYTDTENINCIAKFHGSRDGLTVFATVRQTQASDGKPEAVTFQIGELPANKQTASLVFSLAHAGNPNLVTPENVDPWPTGAFVCEVSVDGAVKATAPFVIQMPKCPVYPAAGGYRCGGFYPPSTVCPSADATVSCTCSPDTGLWVCG
jgi:hypothetical protein